MAQGSLKRGMAESSGSLAQARGRPGQMWADAVGTLLLISSDTLSLALAAWIASQMGYRWWSIEDLSGQMVARLSSVFVLVSVALLAITGAYKLFNSRSFSSEWSHLVSIVSLAYMALGLIALVEARLQAYAAYGFVHWASSVMLLPLGRLATRYTLGALRQQGIGRKRVVIVGTTKGMQQLLRRLDRGGSAYRVVGMVNVDHGCGGRGDRKAVCLSSHEGMDSLPSIIDAQRPAQVLVAMPPWRYRDSREALSSLVPGRLPMRLVPFMPPEGASVEAVQWVDGVPVVEVRDSSFPRQYETLKRALDVVLASAALVLTLPLMALIAIAIKLARPARSCSVRTELDGTGAPFACTSSAPCSWTPRRSWRSSGPLTRPKGTCSSCATTPGLRGSAG